MTLQGHAAGVRACAWSPDGQRLLSASYDKTLKVWEASSGAELMTLVLGTGDETTALDFVNNRVLAALAEAWRFLSWRFVDPLTGRLRLLPAEHFGPLPTSDRQPASPVTG